MSEVQSRPVAARGRGSGRGGRAGHSSRGGGRTGARPAATNGDSSPHETDSALPTLEDDGEIKELRTKYGDKLSVVQEIITEWSPVDLLYALRETEGDVDETVSRIFDGSISQWGEVSKAKKTKAKGDTFTTTTADSVPSSSSQRNTRGGRAVDGGRGGRGRATERGGRGGGRGKSTSATTNGARTKESQPLSVATEESTEWTTTKPADEATAWSDAAPAEPAPIAAAATPTPAPAAPKPSTTQEAAGPKTWASMLRQSTTPKPAPKPKEESPVPEATESVIEPLPPAPTEPEVPEPEEIPAPVEEKEVPVSEPAEEEPPAPVPAVEPPVIPVVPIMPAVVVPEVALLPSKDLLTDKNLDKVPDSSHPPETETARSEAADSWDPRNVSSTATPLSASQQQHQADRTPSSGFAATASKATSRPSTFPRRVLDQLEAVRMPGNRDQVDRAAVQFGAFSLSDAVDDDIDGDREEPETRPQPPQDSPVTQPRTSLPPAQPAPVPESFPTPTQKPAVSQVPTGPAAAAPAAASAPTAPIAANNAQAPAVAQNQHYGRFGHPVPQDSSSYAQSKPYDSFGQQAQQANASAAQSQFDNSFQQAQQPSQVQSQQVGGAFSSAPADYGSSYYTAADHSRYYGGYNNYNQPQGAQGQQDGVSGQAQRSYGGYNASQSDISQYPQSGVQHGQSRFAAASGPAADAAVPTPTQASALPQTSQAAQAQSHNQQPPDYNSYAQHPYFTSPYYASYAFQQQQYGQQAGYGAPYGKGGYQPNQYGMNPGPHAYSNPSAGFGQPGALHRDSGAAAAAAGGLDSYGRASSQSAQQQTGFGGMHDAFGRGASSYQSQTGQAFSTPGSQPAAGSTGVDDLKNFGDVKGAAGPSPSLAAAARPGSAANNAPSQSGLPPPQSSQQSGLGGMGQYGYPAHIQQGHGLHGAQSGAGGYGMSASGAAQSQQGSYGYNQGGFASYYAGAGNHARGWGNNYPQH